MAALTVQDVVMTGLKPTYSPAAAGGDTFVNANGDVILHVKNGGGSPITVTFTSPATVKGLTIQDPSGTVNNGEDEFFGPFDPGLFNAGDGTGVAVGYSDNTSVTVAALRVKRIY